MLKNVAFLTYLLVVASNAYSQGKQTITSLKFIGQYEIPFNKNFKNTTVGGLSGIDYDATHDLYYLISDDRSAKNDARFYAAKIHINNKGIDSVQLTDVKYLLQPDGKPYPSNKQNAKLTPDPESIRYNKVTEELVWLSEGERIINKDTILLNPSVTVVATDGSFKSSYTLPSNLTVNAIEKGPRQNGSLEGLTFSTDYNSLYICLEEPLYQDGPKADLNETNSFVRIYKFNTKKKINTQQYAYKLEKIARAPTPQSGFKVNGVSEILFLESDKLLVVERSFSYGTLPSTIKVFIVDLAKAENIQSKKSLLKTPPSIEAHKKLLLNMNDLGIYIDNIEGITFGPLLPNGHRTLVFVADNNFQPFEKNQFLLFEVMP